MNDIISKISVHTFTQYISGIKDENVKKFLQDSLKEYWTVNLDKD